MKHRFLYPLIVLSMFATLPAISAVATVAPPPTEPTPPPEEPMLYRGVAAVEYLRNRISIAASELEFPDDELIEKVLNDESIFVNASYNIGFTDPAPNLSLVRPTPMTGATVSSTPPPTTAEQAFNLSTDPSAPLKIYLDFDGHTTSGTQWNDDFLEGEDFISMPFDVDGQPSDWSIGEIGIIFDVWRDVADDYAPWQVDVTTKDPGVENLRKSNDGDGNYGIRVVISPSNPTDAGGIAYLDSFDWTTDAPAFAFTDWIGGAGSFTAKYIAQVVSHEVGHTVSLYHDGRGSEEYYWGNSIWGPIMGASYIPVYSTWSKGEYRRANNPEDDTALIASYVPLRSDDYANTVQSATPVTSPDPILGTISTAQDLDVFSVELATAGSITLSGTGIGPAPNLNIGVRIYDPAGQLIGSSIRPGHTIPEFTLNVESGVYTIHISGEGVDRPDYGSLGQYRLTVTSEPSPVSIDNSPLPPASRNVTYPFTFTASGGTPPYRWSVTSGALPRGLRLSTAGVVSGRPSVVGSYSFKVRATDASGRLASQSYSLRVANPLSLTTTRLPVGTTGSNFDTTLVATGGIGPYKWDVSSGDLPGGLTLDPNSGQITGQPTIGTFTFTVRVTDDDGRTASRSFTAAVADPVQITTLDLPAATRGVSYGTNLTASGGSPGYRWSLVSGSLPRGIRLSTSGVLSGRTSVSGSFAISVRVTDSAGRTATKDFTLAVS